MKYAVPAFAMLAGLFCQALVLESGIEHVILPPVQDGTQTAMTEISSRNVIIPYDSTEAGGDEVWMMEEGSGKWRVINTNITQNEDDAWTFLASDGQNLQACLPEYPDNLSLGPLTGDRKERFRLVPFNR